LGEKHEEALATLRYGVLDNKGFLLLTGDVGTGKTTLLNALLRTLDKNTFVAFLRDPALEQLDFFQYIAHAFGMKIDNINSKVSFLIQFENFLQDAYTNKRKVLLIIDEAQRMSQEILEEVRLLSNIEHEESKLLNIFFVGQIEFNDIIHLPENRALRQRITVNYNIEELSEEETRKYIKHRLDIASSKEEIGFFTPVQKKDNGEYVRQGLRLPLPEVREEIFTIDAIKEIYAFSKGYPRLINIICDRALLTGFVEESKSITLKHIKECIQELEIPHNKEKIVVRQKSVTSLKNSLEQLNREFEEKRRLEALQQKQKEDSPRDIIKRLENVKEPIDDFQETQEDNSEPQDIVDQANSHNHTSTSKYAEDMLGHEEETTDNSVNLSPEKEHSYLEEPLNHHEEPIIHGIKNTNTREILDELARLTNDNASAREVPITINDSHNSSSDYSNSNKPSSSRKLIIVGILFAIVLYVYLLLSSENFSSNETTNQNLSKSAIQSSTKKIFDGEKKVQSKENTTANDNVQESTILQSDLKKKPDQTAIIEKVITPALNKKPSSQNVTNSSHVKNSPAKQSQSQKAVGKKGQVPASIRNGLEIREPTINQAETANTEPITNRIQQLKSLITFERLIVPFPTDSSLPQLDSLETLNKLVDSLLLHPSFEVTLLYLIKTKSSTAEIDNLSEFRANALKSYLMGRGLEDSRITIKRLDVSKTSKSEINDYPRKTADRWVAIDVNR